MDDKQLQLKKHYFDINITKEQQTEDYYLDRDFYIQQSMQQSEQLLNQEEDHVQQIKEAEMIAGLKQKTVPAQQIPDEALERMQTEYAEINKGKKLSGKAKSKLKKEYTRKMRQSESARKILKASTNVQDNMTTFIKNQTKLAMGEKNLKGNERKNSSAVALATLMSGDSMIGAVNAMKNLSVGNDATDGELNNKAVETERVLKVIMNFDMSKLKYKNSDEFLSNLGEKLMITNLAMECDNLITDYRKLKAEGKIKKPLPDRFINEADARVAVLTTASTRIQKKAVIMQSPLYSLMSEDSYKKLTIDEAQARYMRYTIEANNPNLSEEEKIKAAENRDYYEAVMSLKNMDMAKDESEKFGRGTDPEKLLEIQRKLVEQKNPDSKDLSEQDELPEFKEASIRAQYNYLVDDHLIEKKALQGNLPFMNGAEAVQYASYTKAENMAYLKTNKVLRQREMRRYYSKLHNGKMISDEELQKLEEGFAEKFEEAEKLSNANDVVREFNSTQSKRVTDFISKVKDKDGNNTISLDRGANAYLSILDNKTFEEKKECYVCYNQLKGWKPDDVKDLSEEQKVKEKQRLYDGMKPLVDFAISFDIKKLEFTKISDLFSRYNEIAPFLNNLEEMQKFPDVFISFGLMDEATWVEFTARILMAHDLSWMIKNKMAYDSSAVSSLVDENEFLKIKKAVEVDINDEEAVEESGLSKEYIKNAKAYEDTSDHSEGVPEIEQISKCAVNLNRYKDVSYYNPGDSMETAMQKYRADAKKRWDGAHK